MAAHLVSDVLNIFRTLQIEILENVCQPPEGVRLDSISRRPKRELRGENMKKKMERENLTERPSSPSQVGVWNERLKTHAHKYRLLEGPVRLI